MKRLGVTLSKGVIVPAIVIAFIGLGYVLLQSDRLSFLSQLLLSEAMFVVMMNQFIPMSNTLIVTVRLMFFLFCALLFMIFASVIIDYCQRNKGNPKKELLSHSDELEKRKEQKHGDETTMGRTAMGASLY